MFLLKKHQDYAYMKMLDNKKGQVIVPTGGGKTYIMIADAIRNNYQQYQKSDNINVVVAPRILLAQQLCNDFTDHIEAFDDIIHVHSGDTEYYSTTSAEDLKLWYLTSQNISNRIIFTTYHSLNRIVESGIPINTVYFDEAHNSCGKKFFEAVKSVSNISNRCYFFTATPRQGRGQTIERGMNNSDVFGQVIANVDAKELIDAGIILPPKVIPYDTNRKRNKVNAHEVDAKNLKDILEDTVEDDSKVLVAAPSTRILWNMLTKTDILDWFKKQNYGVMHITSKHGAYVDGKKVRRDVFFNTLNEWGKSAKKFVVFHYSILSEGINVSGLTHCILLRNQSVVSMAQTVGRVIRLHPDDATDIANGVIPRGQLQLYRKPTGYVTIPIHKNHGKRTLTRLQRVVDEIFIQGIPATAYVG